MSHYANALLAERVFPTPIYYQRSATDPTSTTSTSLLVAAPAYPTPHQSQVTWSQQYYQERAYIVSTGPSSSHPLPGASAWQNATNPSEFDSAGLAAISSFPQATSSQPNPRGYHASPDILPTSTQLACPQHSIVRDATTIPQTSTYLPLFNFREDRRQSPSLVSEYAGWDSPKSTDAEQETEREIHPRPSPINNRSKCRDQSGGPSSRQQSPPPSCDTTSSASQTSVKVEDHEDCFIMELSGSADMYVAGGRMGGGLRLSRRAASAAHLNSLSLSQSLAPPTEVPLRATQASEEMRAGMGVFRLNPFTMHSLSVNAEDGAGVTDDIEWEATQPSWCGGEPHALEEEPLLYEFQLDLYDSGDESQGRGPEEEAGLSELPQSRSSVEIAWSEHHKRLSTASQIIGPDDKNQLRSFSPDFDLHPEDLSHSTFPSLGSRYAQDIQEDQVDDDQGNGDLEHDQHSEPLEEVDYANRSEVDSSSTTTRSVHTPFNDSPHPTHTAFEHQHNSPPLQPSVWDAVNEQYYTSEESRFPTASLVIAQKAAVEMGSAGMRVPRLHETTSHPYMRRSFQYQRPHSQSQTHLNSQGAPQLQSHGFSIVNQTTHHPLHQSYPAQAQHQPYLRPASFSPLPYQENEPQPSAGVPSISITGDHQRMNTGLPPSYMRIIRGPRSQEFEYEQGGGTFGHRGNVNRDQVTRGYTSSSEPSEPPPNAMMPHYIPPVDGSVMVNRRWSLPETATTHSHDGQFLS